MNLFTGSYPKEMNPFSPGQKFDIGFDHVETGTAAENLSFGDAVVKNSGDARVKKPAASGDKFRGIVLKSHTVVTGVGYETNDPAPILRQGRASVTVTEAVDVDDVAFAVVATPGKFCKTATGNVVTGGVFRTAAAAGGVAILEINLP